MSKACGEKNLLVAAGAVAAAVAAVGATVAAGLARAADVHVLRLATGGWALVYTTRDDVGQDVRVLRTGGVYQSATYLGDRRMEPVFAYYRALGRVFELRPHACRILAIGGGGCAFPKLVATTHPDVHLDVVEIDPAVITAARRWFFADEAAELMCAAGGSFDLICDDGRAVLERVRAGSYDAVVLDAFVGAEPVRALATVEAARAARRTLGERGVLLANVVSRQGGTDVSFLRSYVATLSTVFTHVAVAPATDEEHAEEDNYLVVASDAPLSLPDAIPYDEDFLGPVLRDTPPRKNLSASR